MPVSQGNKYSTAPPNEIQTLLTTVPHNLIPIYFEDYIKHFTLPRMATTLKKKKNLKIASVGKDVEEWEPMCIAGGPVTW